MKPNARVNNVLTFHIPPHETVKTVQIRLYKGTIYQIYINFVSKMLILNFVSKNYKKLREILKIRMKQIGKIAYRLTGSV